MKKRIIFAVLCVIMLISALPLSSYALEDPKPKYTPYCAVYNIENDKYCYEESIDTRIAPAGTVKIMTAVLALEYYADNLDTKIHIQNSWVSGIRGVSAGFKAGEVISAEKIISTLVVCGANDSANILANAIAGSTEAFVKQMNQKAAELGMENTNYANPTGTDSNLAYTTVRDVVTISAYASSFPKYTEMSDSPSVTLEPTDYNTQRTLYSRNYFISYYYNPNYHDYSVFGFNAGWSDSAGWCLSIAGKSNSGLTYIVVVMGANNPTLEEGETRDDFFVAAYEDADILLNWAYDNFGYFTIIDTSTMVCEVPVKLSPKVDHVIALPEEKIVAFLPLDTDIDTVVKKTWQISNKELSAPLVKGEKVGTLTVSIEGEFEKTINLVAKNNVNRSWWLQILEIITNIVTHPVTITLSVLVLLLISFYAVYRARYIARKRQVVKYRKIKRSEPKPAPKPNPNYNHNNNNNNKKLR